jgi:phosphoribosyl-dephospho-CoA transferase
VTATSDIDLLFFPRNSAQLYKGMDLFASHAKALPLDGEIIFPAGQAVAWKEWLAAMRASSACRVLVKEKHSVHLSTMDALLHTLEDHTCPL